MYKKRITIDSLDKFMPMNNNVVIRNISDSIEDYCRDKRYDNKLLVVRNEANSKRERSLGEVVASSGTLYISNSEGLKMEMSSNEILNKNVIYDTYSRLYEIRVNGDSSTYYLVRFPDIILVIED